MNRPPADTRVPRPGPTPDPQRSPLDELPMMQRTAVLSLAALPLALLAAARSVEPATAPRQGPQAQGNRIDELLGRELARADERSVQELLARALELRGADGLGAGEDLDRSLDQVLAGANAPGPRAALLAATTRLLGTEADPEPLASALEPLLSSDDPELATTAAGLFGDYVFRSLSRTRRTELAEALLEVAQDTERTPEQRMRFSTSAFSLGAGSTRSQARKVLRGFLESDDPDLRADAALALAASAAQPIEGTVRTELERLEKLPDQRGGLAGVLLKQERLREHFDRQMRDQKAHYESGMLPEELEEFVSVLRMVEERHLEGGKVDEKELVEAAIDGMLGWMDTHSGYMSSEVYAQFFQDLEAEYGGIGAYVNTDPDSGLFTIVQPIYSGPAYRAGLKTDDSIVRVDDWPTLGKDREEVIKRLKGKPNTKVRLYVWRRGMDSELIDRPTEDMVVEVERALVEIPAGAWQLLPGGIGLVELNTFSRVAMEELQRWIPNMAENGMRALVLDMRRNSGGLLTEAREVADLFLDRGKVVVSTEDRFGAPEVHKTREKPLLPPDMPVVILTSRLTASAAEIVAGALQDHGRATVVGRTTFGKGSVQQLLAVSGAKEDRWRDENRNGRYDPWETLTVDHDGDGEMDYAPRVKMTVARYLLPSGRSIHRELDDEGNLISHGGVSPDVDISLPPIDRWAYEEQREVLRSGRIGEYVDEHWGAHRELFGQLAVTDDKDPNVYPDFDALMTSLNTPLSRQQVRRLVRDEIRRRVQDDRGAQFPWGDYVEDVQLQKAIEVALEKLGASSDAVSEYQLVFDYVEDSYEGTIAAISTDDTEELNRARALIREARAAGQELTEAQMDEVLSILEGIDEN